jgi:S-adenosylmethionine:tRNA ribosyltransferase-isomerase
MRDRFGYCRYCLEGAGSSTLPCRLMLLSEFDYPLPEELIAQQPLPERDASRMLVLHRHEERWEDRAFRDLPSFLHPGDGLVLNDSRVLPSRLYGHRAGHTGHIEVLLLHPVSEDALTWRALVRPGRKMRTGDGLEFAPFLRGKILARGELGERTVQFETKLDIYDAIERIGHIPLPPYIKRPDTASDRERYQTVFARKRGSVAAPTAGLHFTPETLARCQAAGAGLARVTLHVGLGTFQPLHLDEMEKNALHSERYSVSPEDWQAIGRAERVVAVGTTSVRTVESVAATGQLTGDTRLFICPGFQFRRVGAMLTNFHLPRTSLLLLVCAFAGRELALAAYRHAVEQRYRFFSYGDCMLIL